MTSARDPFDFGRFHQPKGARKREPVAAIEFADNRVVVGPEIGRLVVDREVLYIPPRIFDMGYVLAENLDRPVSLQQMVARLWGWEQREVDVSFRANITSGIAELRARLGDELGDERWGAIRTEYNYGYKAVREL